uniref:Protein MNN4-like n=1 Tax=Cucumis melo TaxID=3656 RepID=A0A9I9DG53_CUCME
MSGKQVLTEALQANSLMKLKKSIPAVLFARNSLRGDNEEREKAEREQKEKDKEENFIRERLDQEEKEKKDKLRKEEEEKKKRKEVEKKKKKIEEKVHKEEQEEQEEEVCEISASMPIAKIKFDRVSRKAQKEKEKVKTRLLKIKVKAQGVKALAEEKKEIKLKEQKELLNKVNKLALSVENSKEKEKTFEEYCEEFEKEISELSPLKDYA